MKVPERKFIYSLVVIVLATGVFLWSDKLMGGEFADIIIYVSLGFLGGNAVTHLAQNLGRGRDI